MTPRLAAALLAATLLVGLAGSGGAQGGRAETSTPGGRAEVGTPAVRAVLEPLRQALLRGETVTVEGRVYLERRKPTDPDDEPLAGVGVLLVPHSAELLDELEGVKRRARESVDDFREAAPAVRARMIEYETALWRLGYPDAAIRTVTDAQGRFRAAVPGGAWILFAERSVFVKLRGSESTAPPSPAALDPLARYSTTQYQHFQKITRLAGFDAVTMWIRPLQVTPGTNATLTLHDRSFWLSGVIEESEMPRRARMGGRRRH